MAKNDRPRRKQRVARAERRKEAGKSYNEKLLGETSDDDMAQYQNWAGGYQDYANSDWAQSQTGPSELSHKEYKSLLQAAMEAGLGKKQVKALFGPQGAQLNEAGYGLGGPIDYLSQNPDMLKQIARQMAHGKLDNQTDILGTSPELWASYVSGLKPNEANGILNNIGSDDPRYQAFMGMNPDFQLTPGNYAQWLSQNPGGTSAGYHDWRVQNVPGNYGAANTSPGGTAGAPAPHAPSGTMPTPYLPGPVKPPTGTTVPSGTGREGPGGVQSYLPQWFDQRNAASPSVPQRPMSMGPQRLRPRRRPPDARMPEVPMRAAGLWHR